MATATPTVQNPFSVGGKSAIVTGAGSGINYTFTALLLKNNCNVLLADLSLRPEAQALLDAHKTPTPSTGRAVFIKTDVTKWTDLQNLIKVCHDEFGGIDIVVPGAGVYEPHFSNFWHPPGTAKSADPVTGTATENLGHYATLDINLTHPIRLTQLAIQYWLHPSRKTSSPPTSATPETPKRIVHISSIAAQTPGFNTALYQASKHGLSGFIRSMAQLDTLGIRVNGVAPGLIRTPLWTDHPEKIFTVGEGDSWVESEEVADAMWKCCECDEWVGGSVVEVLKGRTRFVGWRMDAGPQGPGAEVTNRAAGVREVFDWLGEEGWGVEG
ncbi:hypothetical protein MBLNU230_g3144t1 [Neophaeotheca triangularis]